MRAPGQGNRHTVAPGRADPEPVLRGLTVRIGELRCRRYQRLPDQQDVIARQTSQLERQQADQIEVIPRTVDGAAASVLPADATDPVPAALIANRSSRPIRNVSCSIETGGLATSRVLAHTRLAHRVGEFVDIAMGPAAVVDHFVAGDMTDRLALIRYGSCSS